MEFLKFGTLSEFSMVQRTEKTGESVQSLKVPNFALYGEFQNM